MIRQIIKKPQVNRSRSLSLADSITESWLKHRGSPNRPCCNTFQTSTTTRIRTYGMSSWIGPTSSNIPLCLKAQPHWCSKHAPLWTSIFTTCVKLARILTFASSGRQFSMIWVVWTLRKTWATCWRTIVIGRRSLVPSELRIGISSSPKRSGGISQSLACTPPTWNQFMMIVYHPSRTKSEPLCISWHWFASLSVMRRPRWCW